jgi:hypothetical protein
MSQRLRWPVAAAATLLTVTIVAYGLNIGRLGLYFDDWRNLGDFALHGQLVQRTARPLNLAVLTLGWQLFGLNISYYLALATLFVFLSAFMAWLLLYVLLPRSFAGLALVIAALFVVYPSNYTRLWYTLWPTGLLVAIVFGGILAYALFLRRDQSFLCVVSLVLLGASLMWYELQLGLIAALPLLGVPHLRGSTWQRRLLIVSPTLLACLFVVWWVLAPTASQEYGPSGLVFSVGELLRRLIRGYWSILVVAWIEPVRYINLPPLGRLQAVLIFLATMLASALVVLLLSQRLSAARGPETARLQVPSGTSWFVSVLVAIIVIGVGILPGLPRAEIGVAIFDSRFSLFAALGAACLVVLALYGLAKLVTKHHGTSMYFAYGMSTVLVVFAVIYQLGAQRAMIAGWERQKCAWHSMLAQAPSFKDDTHVHILDVPVSSGIWDVSPFGLLVAEADSAIKLLYNNSTVMGTFRHFGDLVTIDGLKYRLVPGGIFSEDTGKLVPYRDAVIFRYNADDGLDLLKEVPAELSGADGPRATGVERILPAPVVSPYRRLIEPQPQCAYSS